MNASILSRILVTFLTLTPSLAVAQEVLVLKDRSGDVFSRVSETRNMLDHFNIPFSEHEISSMEETREAIAGKRVVILPRINENAENREMERVLENVKDELVNFVNRGGHLVQMGTNRLSYLSHSHVPFVYLELATDGEYSSNDDDFYMNPSIFPQVSGRQYNGGGYATSVNLIDTERTVIYSSLREITYNEFGASDTSSVVSYTRFLGRGVISYFGHYGFYTSDSLNLEFEKIMQVEARAYRGGGAGGTLDSEEVELDVLTLNFDCSGPVIAVEPVVYEATNSQYGIKTLIQGNCDEELQLGISIRNQHNGGAIEEDSPFSGQVTITPYGSMQTNLLLDRIAYPAGVIETTIVLTNVSTGEVVAEKAISMTLKPVVDVSDVIELN